MKQWIALLRGVNVGGKNKVPMPALQAAMEQTGLSRVHTYLNSGNVLFAAEGNAIELQKQCRQIIQDTFDLDIAVHVISARELSEAMAHVPAWWGKEEHSKHNAIFVISPATTEAVIQSVGEARPEFERIAPYGRVIFWSAPIQTFSRTRWSSVSKSGAYASITIRSANTTKKLWELSERSGDSTVG